MFSLLCRMLVARGFEIIASSENVLEVKRVGSNTSALINLSNFYRRLKSLPESKHLEAVTHFSERISLGYGDIDVGATPLIFPRIVPYVQNPALSAPWSKSLIANQLDLTLVADHGVVMKSLNPIQIIQFGKPLKTLLAEAMLNLTSVAIPRVVPDAGVLKIEIGDGHDAARVLIAREIWPDTTHAALPSRDSLWLSTSTPSPTLRSAVEGTFRHTPYPISSRWFDIQAFDGE